MSLGRIRSIKPENWQDEAVGSVSRDARLLRDVLFTLADDDGRWRQVPSIIIGHGYPYDDDVTPVEIKKWSAELHAAGVTHLYESDGAAFGCFPKWHSHQVINKYKPSIFPAPKDVRCSRRSTKKPSGKGSDVFIDSRSGTGGLREQDGSPPTLLPEGSGPDQRDPFPAPFPAPAVEIHARAGSELAEHVQAVVDVIRDGAPSQTFDPGCVGVVNVVAAFAEYDHTRAAHLVVARAADPSWRTKDAARSLEYVLKTMDPGKPKTSSTDRSQYDRKLGLTA